MLQTTRVWTYNTFMLMVFIYIIFVYQCKVCQDPQGAEKWLFPRLRAVIAMVYHQVAGDASYSLFTLNIRLS